MSVSDSDISTTKGLENTLASLKLEIESDERRGDDGSKQKYSARRVRKG